MPPQAALIICTIFVLWLLRLDYKQSPKVSFAIWIPTIWMLVIASKPLGSWFGTGGESMEKGSEIDRVFLSVILFLSLLILIKRHFKWSNVVRQNAWLMLLIGYMFISILWSDIPFVSFKRWTKQLIALVISFLIATEPEPRQAIQSILRRIIYVLIPFSYILIHYFPEHGREYNRWSGELMWLGVTTQKNSLGLFCLFAAFFLIWSFIRRRQGKDPPATRYQTPIEAFILIVTLWLMGGPQHNFSYSATTNVAFSIGLSALIGLSWMKKHGIAIGSKALIVIVAFSVFYGTVTPFAGKLSVVDISSTFGRDETLSGRSEIWAELIPLAMKRPILGHGFGGFWTTEASQKARISAAHNGYLDIVLDLGFIGYILFFMFLLSCCQKARREMTTDSDWGICFFCYLLMAVVHNIAESSTVGIAGRLSAILLILAVSSSAGSSNNQMVWRKV
jgi:exopolysaccharide production protein ExoQ